MDKFLIEKSPPLAGKIRVSGAKNACLPLMAASLLTEEPIELENVPNLVDVQTMAKVLENLGVKITREPGKLKLQASGAEGYTAPYELVRTMRASYYVLGPLTARKGKAEVSLPGGCARGVHSGPRPQATRQKDHSSNQHGSSVGATINLMLAATLAKGVTVLEGAAREPEVEEVARMLSAMGAVIEGAGTSEITIEGVSQLGGASHRVIPDRVEAGTFAVAAAITGGKVLIQDCRAEHLKIVLDLLESLGVKIEIGKQSILVSSKAPLSAFSLSTEPYPGFPTDMQAQFCALATQARGVSVIEENIFENRFLHVPELARLGADIRIEGNRVIIRGVTPLSSAPVMASDLRASAALVLAALVAEGTSEINRIYHLDRGYENLEVKLARLGAKIIRVSA